MSRKLVIAYYMHESERAAAEQMIEAAETTDSFVMGEMDDADIENAMRQGLIIRNLEPPVAAPAESQRPNVDAAAMMMESLGVDLDAAVPAPQDYYVVHLLGPIIESRRERLGNAGIQLLEWDAEDHGYKVFLNAQQVAAAKAFDFVESVSWISPKRSAPVWGGFRCAQHRQAQLPPGAWPRLFETRPSESITARLRTADCR